MPKDLVDAQETPRFVLCLLVSVLVYAVFVLSIVGAVYLLAGGAIFLVVHGLETGRLRGDALRLSEEQFPEVLAEVRRLCAALDLEVPEVYVEQAGGALNAFARRFGDRNFVVVYSDAFELALEQDREALSFVLAHELAHLKRGHPAKHFWLLPGLMVPLLGAAYSRACERTCDRIATWLCPGGVELGLLTLAAGRRLAPHANGQAFVEQTDGAGQWTRLSEVLSTHPHLANRLDAAADLRDKLRDAAPAAASLQAGAR